MTREEQDKVLIHELLHIPLSFGGGFKHHDFVQERNFEKIYEKYKQLKGLNIKSDVNHVQTEIKKHEQKKKSFFGGGWF